MLRGRRRLRSTSTGSTTATTRSAARTSTGRTPTRTSSLAATTPAAFPSTFTTCTGATIPTGRSAAPSSTAATSTRASSTAPPACAASASTRHRIGSASVSVTHHPPRGRRRSFVRVPNPGTLVASGKRVKTIQKTTAGGKVSLTIVAKRAYKAAPSPERLAQSPGPRHIHAGQRFPQDRIETDHASRKLSPETSASLTRAAVPPAKRSRSPHPRRATVRRCNGRSPPRRT